MVIDDRQRAQLFKIMSKYKDLWIAKQLWNLALGYEYISTRVCVDNRGVNYH